MPNTIVGLVLFVLLGTPGLLHVLITERGARPVRGYSVFRETVTVGVVSVAANGAALLLFACLHQLLPDRTPDIAALVRDPQRFWQDSYSDVLTWATSLFAVACLMALLLGRWRNKAAATPGRSKGGGLLAPVMKWLVPGGGVDFVSGWWKLIELPAGLAKNKRITCTLSDGSRIQGWYFSHNSEAGDGPDRDLLLAAPLTFRDVDGTVRHEPKGAACISARHIVLMQVEYQDAE
ncbi:MAG: DUF6338 family protein [Candidatus Phosphoribacter sp.]|nr:hypothetical protein [Actinomycetales bacterium]